MRSALKLTYADYCALPENGKVYQLVEGELCMSPSPRFYHQSLVARIFNSLFNHCTPTKRGWVRTGPIDVILDDENVLVPDVVYVSKERKSVICPEGLRGPADLTVEVLSPSNARLDRQVKRQVYARFGVPEMWIVDPDARRIEVFRLQENPDRPARIFEANETLTTDLLPDLRISLTDVFAEDTP